MQPTFSGDFDTVLKEIALLLQSILETGARETPKNTALVCQDRRVTYSELDQAANQLAHGLIRLGLRPGEPVAVCLQNSFEAVVSLFAVLKAGGVLTLAPVSENPDAGRFLLEHSQAALLITSLSQWAASFTSHRQPLPATLRGAVLVGQGAAQGQAGGFAPVPFYDLLSSSPASRPQPGLPRIDLDPAVILCASGRQRVPRGSVHSHRGLLSLLDCRSGFLPAGGDDIVLSVLRLTEQWGFSVLITTLGSGATLVLEQALVRPASLVEIINREGVTLLPAPAALLKTLMVTDLTNNPIRSLRALTVSVTDIAPELLTGLPRKLPGVPVLATYSQAECLQLSGLAGHVLAEQPDALGQALPNVRCRVVNRLGEPAPAGEIGELRVRGSLVMVGYWKHPLETGEALISSADGLEQWLRTGLYAWGDESGLLTRVKPERRPRDEEDLQRIRTVLECYPDVREAVVELVDRSCFAPVRATVLLELNSRCSVETLREYCLLHLGPEGLPDEFYLRLADTPIPAPHSL